MTTCRSIKKELNINDLPLDIVYDRTLWLCVKAFGGGCCVWLHVDIHRKVIKHKLTFFLKKNCNIYDHSMYGFKQVEKIWPILNYDVLNFSLALFSLYCINNIVV